MQRRMAKCTLISNRIHTSFRSGAAETYRSTSTKRGMNSTGSPVVRRVLRYCQSQSMIRFFTPKQRWRVASLMLMIGVFVFRILKQKRKIKALDSSFSRNAWRYIYITKKCLSIHEIEQFPRPWKGAGQSQ